MHQITHVDSPTPPVDCVKSLIELVKASRAMSLDGASHATAIAVYILDRVVASRDTNILVTASVDDSEWRLAIAELRAEVDASLDDELRAAEPALSQGHERGLPPFITSFLISQAINWILKQIQSEDGLKKLFEYLESFLKGNK